MKKIALFFVFAIMLSSCSYRFVGSYSGLAGGISKIYVDNIKNITSEPNLELYLRSDLINTLDLDSRVSVAKKQNADGYLSVKIVSYDISPVAFNSNGLTSMYRCTIATLISLKDKNGKYIIKDKKLISYRNYDATDDVSATEKAKSTISKDVLKDLAQKIDNELFVDF